MQFERSPWIMGQDVLARLWEAGFVEEKTEARLGDERFYVISAAGRAALAHVEVGQ